MGKEELMKLYNTLSLVETKGESTKIMGQCLQFIEQKIAEANAPKDQAKTEARM